jgi:hypothetical protein
MSIFTQQRHRHFCYYTNTCGSVVKEAAKTSLMNTIYEGGLMYRFIQLSFLILPMSLLTACGVGRGELVGLLKENQTQLQSCRTDLVSAEKARSELELEKLKLERSSEGHLGSARAEAPRARAITGETIVHEMTNEELTRLAESAGASVKPVGSQLLATFGRLKTFLIYNPKDHVLTAHARFTGYKGDLSVLNEWNRTRRFSRAYLDEDRDLVLEAELDVEFGVSPDAIRSWIRGFGIVLNVFSNSLSSAEGGGGAPSGPSDSEIESHSI